MAAVLISVLFSPFFYGLELFLASTLTTQVAISVATVVVSTATLFYCQRALYQWYEGTAEFVVRIRNKVGLGERHVTFSARGHKIGLEEETEDEPTIEDTSGRMGESAITAPKEVAASEKPDIPLDSWMKKQTVAMHRSHWVAKPGRIAPTTFIGFGRRGSSDSIPIITRSKTPPSTTPGGHREERAKLDRRLSSPSSFGIPRSKRTHAGRLESTSSADESYATSQESTPGPSTITSTEVKRETEGGTISRDPPSLDRSSSDDVALAQDEPPQVKVVPCTAESEVVREAVLVDSSSSAPSLRANVQPIPVDNAPSPPSSQANVQSLPVDSSDSDRQTSEERSSGQTDTDSLATDDIFSDSELDDSKRSDDVFLHDEAAPVPAKVPPRDISGDDCLRTEGLSPKGPQPNIIVCEAAITAGELNENIEVEPDSSVSLSVEGGPVPRKDSFGLLPVLKCRVQHVKIESTSFAGPVAAISIEEAKSESDGDASEKASETPGKTIETEPERRPYPLQPQKQDSLGVPPVLTGEVAFPGAIPKQVKQIPPPRTKATITKMSKVDSLEVPPMLKVKDSLPPYPKELIEARRKREKPALFQEIKVRLPPKRKGRPNSLDIPSLNVSESCPPRKDFFSELRVSPTSSSSSLRDHSKLRKQGPSILKRSGSVDRAGPKKSVTFSPIVIPWGGSSEEGIEPSGGKSDLKRSIGSSSPIRPKVIRYHSVDVPDTMRRRQRTEFIRQLGMHGELSDEDQDMLEEERHSRFLRRYTQREDRQGTKFLLRKRIGIDEGPIKTDPVKLTSLEGAVRKSAKERFLEASGAKAVITVLLSQDSSEKGSPTLSSSLERKDSPPIPPAKDDDGTTSWAKSRFLMSGDGTVCKASRFFVEQVKGSVDLSESQSDHSSPSDTNEDTSSSSEQQFEETDEGGIRSTSAKSRFLWSCRENMTSALMASGTLPADRFFALWEPAPLTLPGLPEADETGEDAASGTTQGNVKDKPSASETTIPDKPKGTTHEEIDSPESSGVHSMDHDETVSERLTSLAQDSKTKHVPSNSSCTSTPSRTRQLKTAIVVDNGSQFIKVGLIDESKPSIELPNVISRDRIQSFNSRFIGLDAVKNCSISPFEYPITGGLIQNWEDVESIWKYVFDDKLGLLPKEHPLLMTEIATVPKQQREKAMEVLFETFNAPGIYFSNQASLALRATGRTTGLALSSGSGVTEVVPVHNGITLTRAVTKLDLGGRSATKHMAHLIEKDTGHRLLTSPGSLEVLRELKEDQTYVTKVPQSPPSSEEHGDTPWNCWLPDGSTVEVKREHVHQCAEPLFQPALAGILHQPGMPNLVADCLDRCDQNALSEFPSSLLLCGGNTYLGGMTERLQAELNTLGLGYIEVEAPKGRDLLSWIGGAMVAAQLDSENQWLTTEEYAEHGGSIVHKRCT